MGGIIACEINAAFFGFCFSHGGSLAVALVSLYRLLLGTYHGHPQPWAVAYITFDLYHISPTSRIILQKGSFAAHPPQTFFNLSPTASRLTHLLNHHLRGQQQPPVSIIAWKLDLQTYSLYLKINIPCRQSPSTIPVNSLYPQASDAMAPASTRSLEGLGYDRANVLQTSWNARRRWLSRVCSRSPPRQTCRLRR